jgi:dTDP-4-dehydrorhamnose reductase
MKILVTGGGGLLAWALRQCAPAQTELTLTTHAEFDLTKPDQMSAGLRELSPQIVINTASYNLVDRCETERDLSWAVNAAGPQALAELCARSGIKLVHYGTDYVFDGGKSAPYVETDPPNALNHYAAGKLYGERAVLAAAARHLALRPSWIFGEHPTQVKTYVHTVLHQARAGRPLKATTDQTSIPTYAPDLARWTWEFLARDASGLFHAVNDEGISRYDWTRVIVAEALEAGLIPGEVPVEPVTSAYFNPTMKRPEYTVLDNHKTAALLGHPLGSWRAGLKHMLQVNPTW